MISEFLLALQIAALGMGIVFGAIILLWGMMSLLTMLTAEEKPVQSSAPAAPSMDSDLRSRAAAVAVALALAEARGANAQALPTPPTAIVSAWQLGMRTRQLHQKGQIRRPGRTGDR